MASIIDTAAKRSKLSPRKNPYWQGVSGGRGGVSLGFRKGENGPGSWIAKIVLDGSRFEERLGFAESDNAPSNTLTYASAVTAALEWGRRQFSVIETGRQSNTKAPTVRSAIDAYIVERNKRSTGANAASRLKRHVLADPKLPEILLSKLRASSLEEWRSRLPSNLASSSVNRLLNDLRAALNATAEKYRRELSAHVPAEIKAGTKASEVHSTARRQLLTDQQVRSVVEAAISVDEDGDFGRLVMLAAATGARYSQLAKLKVGDVQKDRQRIMVPPSKKGRGRKMKAAVAVPIDQGALELLKPALKARNPNEPLLLRWSFHRTEEFRWEHCARRPLGAASEIKKQWAHAVKKSKLPKGTVMYALRHSSIVRGLRANLPVRLVAALHDTSIEMIETHYSAFIVDMTEDLARQTMMKFENCEILQAAE